MRTLLKWGSLTLISVLLLGGVFIYVVATGINDVTKYTESDFFNYRILTDKEIAQAPRISPDYVFVSQPGDGHAPSNAIIFQRVADVEPLRAYLQGLGYHRDKRRLGANEVWLQQERDGGAIFYLSFDRGTGEAVLTKVQND
ncbi:TPA: hypothetical protein PPN70_003534 [Serratia rubidaea]|uniref:hypothetical protein n=1 Tax=Serratia rubidaea TaxID=61652 RepID=UPI0023AEAA43|nr:hypothetical protein [Serratia rubidaea]MDK1702993.1 hypothetical protein [Serratia rubidaea]HDJ1441089.1 hypothetical protein [Serratia rubidaea]HDJ1450382.1 hypothetical protein [Serratia rubidaea]HDJ1462568.1 hypothetical protein [Serratia rubidaea]HDJ2774714.1 hypothetical protein [Serratia rubidaea]